MKTTIRRLELVQTVARSLPFEYESDLPAIRQALNDTADSYRKDGFAVRDSDQDRMVADVRAWMRAKNAKALETAHW